VKNLVLARMGAWLAVLIIIVLSVVPGKMRPTYWESSISSRILSRVVSSPADIGARSSCCFAVIVVRRPVTACLSYS
jgi:hypothetical protein